MIYWWYEYNKFCFSFGSRVSSWCLKKQEVIAQSTAKVENETTNTTVNQAIWLRTKVWSQIGLLQDHWSSCSCVNKGSTKGWLAKLGHF